MISIDLNCDMGEGMNTDKLIMPFISSANIACGYHAGNVDIMKRTIELCLQYDVAIGAHPGFNDKENFGRYEQNLSDDDYYQLISGQLHILQKCIEEAGGKMHHVKPHGALYNMSAKNKVLAGIIAKAVKDYNGLLVLYGLSNSCSITEAENIGLTTASEVFADRTYNDEGFLTPRSQPGALIHDERQSVQQVLQMITEQTVTSTGNKTINIKADTVCLHGDGKHAVVFARLIFKTLKGKNIVIKAAS